MGGKGVEYDGLYQDVGSIKHGTQVPWKEIRIEFDELSGRDESGVFGRVLFIPCKDSDSIICATGYSSTRLPRNIGPVLCQALQGQSLRA